MYLRINVSTNFLTIFVKAYLKLWKQKPPFLWESCFDFINQSYATDHSVHRAFCLTKPQLICNKKFPNSTKVSKNESDKTLLYLTILLQRQTCLPTKIPCKFLNFLQALPIPALTVSDAPTYKINMPPR